MDVRDSVQRSHQGVNLLRASWCQRAPEGHIHRVLVAEDDAALRNLLTDYLRSERYAVAARADGAEALDEALLWRPCLALVDLKMPGTDGVSFVAACRTDVDLRELPILLASGAGVEVPSLQVQGFVPKPFDLDDLLATIAATIGGGARDGDSEPQVRQITPQATPN